MTPRFMLLSVIALVLAGGQAFAQTSVAARKFCSTEWLTVSQSINAGADISNARANDAPAYTFQQQPINAQLKPIGNLSWNDVYLPIFSNKSDPAHGKFFVVPVVHTSSGCLFFNADMVGLSNYIALASNKNLVESNLQAFPTIFGFYIYITANVSVSQIRFASTSKAVPAPRTSLNELTVTPWVLDDQGRPIALSAPRWVNIDGNPALVLARPPIHLLRQPLRQSQQARRSTRTSPLPRARRRTAVTLQLQPRRQSMFVSRMPPSCLRKRQSG